LTGLWLRPFFRFFPFLPSSPPRPVASAISSNPETSKPLEAPHDAVPRETSVAQAPPSSHRSPPVDGLHGFDTSFDSIQCSSTRGTYARSPPSCASSHRRPPPSQQSPSSVVCSRSPIAGSPPFSATSPPPSSILSGRCTTSPGFASLLPPPVSYGRSNTSSLPDALMSPAACAAIGTLSTGYPHAQASSQDNGTYLPAEGSSKAVTCPHGSGSRSQLEAALGPPRVPMARAPTPGSGQLRGHHVSPQLGLPLPAQGSSRAAMCPGALWAAGK
jgi:hypothetical protein